MVHIEYEGVHRNLDHLAEPVQRPMIREAALCAAGMRPPILSAIVAGVDVTKQPELWPPSERNYHGPGRLELLSPDADGKVRA